MVPDNRISIRLILVITVVALGSVGQGAEVRWIQGQSYPHPWSIEPTQPIETEVIQFSGPTRYFVNHCAAERMLGGKPALVVNRTTKTIELRFDPPPTSDCTSALSPVCGLEGLFGPLEIGTWRFFCTKPGVTFSLDIQVAAVPPKPVYFVDANATGENTGQNWDDAFTDLQNALKIAVPGSEIRVAKGTYRPQPVIEGEFTNPNSTFKLGPGVVLKGGYAGLKGTNPNERDVVEHETVLSGDLLGDDDPIRHPADVVGDYERGDNVYHVVTLSGADSASVLDGFTITGGIAIDSVMPDKPGGGGGIYNEGGKATVRNCLIIGNMADYFGGGIYNSGAGSLTFVTCIIADNWAQWSGGGIFSHWSGLVTMSQCVLSNNGAQYSGGAVSGQSLAEFMISNCIISGNTVAEPSSGSGGALYNFVSDIHLNNCTIVGNRAAVATAMRCEGINPSIKSGLYLGNCIVWGDGEVITAEAESLLQVSYSDIRGGWPGRGNIDADPCFVQVGQWDDAGTERDLLDDSWVEGDYHLKAMSACIDTGSMEAVADGDETDLDGQPRLSGFAPDMGVYEVRNDPPFADAGPDVTGFTLDGVKGPVILDGNKSYDPEGQPLQYRWYKGNELVSEQARFTIVLPLGEYNFRLVVTDPTGFSGSDETKATITWVLSTEAMVSPQVIDRKSSKAITAVVVLPKGTSRKDVDLSQPLVLFPGSVPAMKQTALVWLSGYTLVLADFSRADLVAAVPQNGQVELQIVGRLKNGQHFSGRDTVTIK